MHSFRFEFDADELIHVGDDELDDLLDTATRALAALTAEREARRIAVAEPD